MDATCNTNRHSRPFACINSVHSENKTTCTSTSLFYDEIVVSFNFNLKALVILYGTTYLNATSIFLTGGHKEMIAAINSFMSLGVLNSKTKWRLFYWHGVTLHLNKELSDGKSDSVILLFLLVKYYVNLAASAMV